MSILYDGKDPNMVIPELARHATITCPKLPKEAFRNSFHLRSIYLTNKVIDVGDDCFQACVMLEQLQFAKNSLLQRINDKAFFMCASLQHVSLPEGLQRLGAQSFFACHQLQSIRIPSTLQEIERETFQCCLNLRTVILSQSNYSSSLKTIGDEAFMRCESLTNIRLPTTVTKVGIRAFAHCYELEQQHRSAMLVPPHLTLVEFLQLNNTNKRMQRNLQQEEQELNEFLSSFDYTNEPTIDKDQHGKLYNNIYDQDWDAYGQEEEVDYSQGGRGGIQTYFETDNEQVEKLQATIDTNEKTATMSTRTTTAMGTTTTTNNVTVENVVREEEKEEEDEEQKAMLQNTTKESTRKLEAESVIPEPSMDIQKSGNSDNETVQLSNAVEAVVQEEEQEEELEHRDDTAEGSLIRDTDTAEQEKRDIADVSPKDSINVAEAEEKAKNEEVFSTLQDPSKNEDANKELQEEARDEQEDERMDNRIDNNNGLTAKSIDDSKPILSPENDYKDKHAIESKVDNNVPVLTKQRESSNVLAIQERETEMNTDQRTRNQEYHNFGNSTVVETRETSDTIAVQEREASMVAEIRETSDATMIQERETAIHATDGAGKEESLIYKETVEERTRTINAGSSKDHSRFISSLQSRKEATIQQERETIMNTDSSTVAHSRFDTKIEMHQEETTTNTTMITKHANASKVVSLKNSVEMLTLESREDCEEEREDTLRSFKKEAFIKDAE